MLTRQGPTSACAKMPGLTAPAFCRAAGAQGPHCGSTHSRKRTRYPSTITSVSFQRFSMECFFFSRINSEGDQNESLSVVMLEGFLWCLSFSV